MTALGAALRDLRRARRLSQAELARMTGIDHTLLSRIESGARATVSLGTLRKLARCLDLTVEETRRLGYAALATERERPGRWVNGARVVTRRTEERRHERG